MQNILFTKLFSHCCRERICPVCHIPFIPLTINSVGKYLCATCANKIIVKPKYFCHLCGHALMTEARTCLSCLVNPPVWNELYYYAPYEGFLKELVLHYKYSKRFSLIPFFTFCLSEASLFVAPYDLFIPMPRHEKRLVQEGWNHILELCREFQKVCCKPLAIHSLERTRYTTPQAGLSLDQRLKNPLKSFSAKGVRGKRVLLLDDVMTSGGTAKHATLALKKAGAEHVGILLIARAAYH